VVGNALIDRVSVLIHLQSALSQMLFIYMIICKSHINYWN
jgi:hypothetical protein